MSRCLSLISAMFGLFMAAVLAAQTPPPAPSANMKAAYAPPPALTPDDTWNLDLSTGGRVVIQLRPDVAPNHVERVKTLTRQGFYNGLAFFRVIEGFMAQGGDPQNNGSGGSTLPNLNAEIHGLLHVRGAVAAARTAQDQNSANSQFYIMFVPRLNMDRGYSVFGRVVSGMNFVDAIVRGEPPANPSRIIRASLGSDNVPPMSAEELRAAAERLAAASAPSPIGTNAPLQLPTRQPPRPAREPAPRPQH